MVHFSVVQYSLVWYGIEQCGAVQFSVSCCVVCRHARTTSQWAPGGELVEELQLQDSFWMSILLQVEVNLSICNFFKESCNIQNKKYTKISLKEI